MFLSNFSFLDHFSELTLHMVPENWTTREKTSHKLNYNRYFASKIDLLSTIPTKYRVRYRFPSLLSRSADLRVSRGLQLDEQTTLSSILLPSN